MTTVELMSPSSGTKRPLRSSGVALVGAFGAILFAGAVVVAVAGAPPARRTDRGVLEALVVGTPIVAGLYAAKSRHHARFGTMLLAAATAWSLTALAETTDSLTYSIGRVAAWLVFPMLMYLLLTFPRHRIAKGFDQGVFAAGTVVLAVLFVGSALFVEAYPTHTPWATCDRDCPPNAFLVLDREPEIMQSAVTPIREGLTVLVFAGISWSLLRRFRSASPVERRSSGPVILMSVLSCAVLLAYFPTRRFAEDATVVDTLATLWALSIAGVAATFLAGLVQRRVFVASVLSRLGAALADDVDVPRLRSTLATALGDPTVDVLISDTAPGRWHDVDGTSTTLAAAAGSGRAVTRIDHDNAPLAALVHDPALAESDELLEAVGSIIGLTLRHRLLEGRLARSLGELDESRKRLTAAADLERARIERDLHDGAQQRLIMLRIKLSLAEDLMQADAEEGAAAVGALGRDVDQTLDELRALAHGVYPSLLSDRGVADAMRSAVMDSPIPVQLSARGVTRQPPEIATAVYFACLEAFQNALKHATGATRIWITLRQDDAFRFEVRDDGVGFDLPETPINGGLANMRDRVEAIGGRLLIESSPGQGTRIRGTVPLG